MIRQAGNDGGHHHAHGHARLGQGLDGAESLQRVRGARLHHPLDRGIERGDREIDRDGAVKRQLAQPVDVADDEGVLGDEDRGIAELGEHREAASRDAELALDRLIHVGDAGQTQHLRLPAARRERFAQQLGRALLHQDARLEVEPGGESEVLVGRARVAVDAAVLAPAVGVQAGVEAHVGTVVVGDDAARGVAHVERSGTPRLFLSVDRLLFVVEAIEAVGR